MIISLIVAMSDNRVIGIDNQLPWHISADLRRFKRLTLNHHLVMGRKTYQSIGKALPERTNVIITTQTDFSAPDCTVVHSLDQALETARQAGETECFIGGGAEIYRLALPQADKIYLTRVYTELEGHVHFPEWNESEWNEVEREERSAKGKNPYDYSFCLYERKQEE